MCKRNGKRWNTPEILRLQREYELLNLPIEKIAKISYINLSKSGQKQKSTSIKLTKIWIINKKKKEAGNQSAIGMLISPAPVTSKRACA